MEIAGFIFAIIIGLVLGLIGGGGSILSVPVFVYLFDLNVIHATTISLFVVGITSLFGSVNYFKKGYIHINTALLFGISSVVSVIITRRFLVPAIPDNLLMIGNYQVTKRIFVLVLFSVLMLYSAINMIWKKSKRNIAPNTNKNYSKLIIQGLSVGFITGLIGAGGGFLIVPALVMIIGLEMKAAIGTSLFIIALNALIGFFFSKDIHQIDWSFLLTFTGLSIAGLFIGLYLSSKIDGNKLKPAFGWFVFIIGIYILVKELL